MARLSLGIRTRINGGFGLLLMLGLGLAAYGTLELARVDDEVGRLSALSDNNTRVLELGRSFEAMRYHVTRFRGTGDEAALQEAIAAETRSSELLKAALAGASSAESRQVYAAALQTLDGYRVQRETLTQLTREALGAQQALDASGEQLTEVLGKLVDAALATSEQMASSAARRIERSFLTMRVINWRFVASHDAAVLETFTRNAQRAASGLVAMNAAEPPDDVRALIAPARAALAQYVKSFEVLSGGITRADGLYASEMTPRLRELDAQIGGLQASISRDFAAIKHDTQKAISTTVTSQMVVGGAALVIGLFLAFLLSRSITRPIAGITGAMGRIADGDNEIEIPSRESSDEIGRMARALEVLRQNSLERARLREQQKAMELRAAGERRDSMNALADDFERNVGGIVQAVATAASEMQGSAHSMAGTAEAVTRRASAVSAASTQASANVQTVASATEELTASISEIGAQVERSSQIAARAVEDARRTDTTVESLAKGAEKIGEVVGLIQSIAAQTNLLALNATIEAARAGDAGKGFAVVASEVKSLASQTARATEEIAAQIAAIQDTTGQAVSAIRGIGATIGEMSEIASGIAAAVEEQNAATREIAGNVQQAARGTDEVSANIAGVTDASNEVGSAASQVLGAAEDLARQSDRLKKEMASFLATVRAA